LDFELNASEFQGTEWVHEEVSEGLIPRFEAPQYVGSALGRELLPEPLVEIAPQGYTSADAKVETGQVLPAHPSRAITGPKCFGALTALDEQEVADPWTSQDPWTRVESITGSVDSLPPLSAEFARQNAEMDAARLDIVSLFTTHQVSGGLPAPTDEPGKEGETPERKGKRLQFSIATPETGSEGRTRRFDGRNRRRVDAATSPFPPTSGDLFSSDSSPVTAKVPTRPSTGKISISDYKFISSVDIVPTSIDIGSNVSSVFPMFFTHCSKQVLSVFLRVHKTPHCKILILVF